MKAAEEFDALCQECNGDEMQAFEQYARSLKSQHKKISRFIVNGPTENAKVETEVEMDDEAFAEYLANLNEERMVKFKMSIL